MIDLDRATAASSRTLNEGLAYLVLASGTQADNRTSSWSTTSVATYAGIGVERAGEAIGRLVSAGDLSRHSAWTKARPRHVFAELGQRTAWLPRSLVEGAAPTHVPLLQRLRQTGDRLYVGLLLELYGIQNLAADAGLSRSFAVREFERRPVTSVGAHDVWAFGFELAQRFMPIPAESRWARYLGGPHDQTLQYRLEQLLGIGALEWAPYLFESRDPDSEPLLPVDPWGVGLPALAAELCTEIAMARVGEGSRRRLEALGAVEGYPLGCALLRHRADVVMQGVLRLTHRPRTANAARLVARDWGLVERLFEEAHEVLPADKLERWQNRLQALRAGYSAEGEPSLNAAP